MGFGTSTATAGMEYRAAERSPSLDPMAQLNMLTKQERKAAFGNAEPNVILSDFDADAINEGLKTILKKATPIVGGY